MLLKQSLLCRLAPHLKFLADAFDALIADLHGRLHFEEAQATEPPSMWDDLTEVTSTLGPPKSKPCTRATTQTGSLAHGPREATVERSSSVGARSTRAKSARRAPGGAASAARIAAALQQIGELANMIKLRAENHRERR